MGCVTPASVTAGEGGRSVPFHRHPRLQRHPSQRPSFHRDLPFKENPSQRSPKQRPPWTESPTDRTPLPETTLDKASPPWTENPPSLEGDSSEGTWDQAQRPPPRELMAHACENITWPQTSFAGGKYHVHFKDMMQNM